MARLEDSVMMPLMFALEKMQEKICTTSTYFGIPTLKNPLDMWTYQELITRALPDVIVEIGTFRGGSALALAHICDQLKNGQVISVDIDQKNVTLEHPRIKFIESDARAAFDEVRERCKGANSVMVIEDSSHEYHQTLEVLNAYSPLVTKGSYFIVEDTVCHHGLKCGPTPGPYEAVEDFLKFDKRFVADRDCEPYLITWNPNGYLRRIL